MNERFNYKVNPIVIALGSTFLTLLNAFASNFGRIEYRNHFHNGVGVGIFLIFLFLVLPIFFKEYRKYIWTKKGLLPLIIALIINIPIVIICLKNNYSVV